MSTPSSPPSSPDGSAEGSASKDARAKDDIIVRFPNTCDLLSFTEGNALLDVRLRSSDGHVVPANSTLLALKSKFFLSLLHGSFRESTTRVAHFPFKRRILVDLIKYIYKEQSDIIDKTHAAIRAERNFNRDDDGDNDDDDETGSTSSDEQDDAAGPDGHHNAGDIDMQDHSDDDEGPQRGRRSTSSRGTGTLQRRTSRVAMGCDKQSVELLVTDLLALAQASDYIEFDVLLIHISELLPQVSSVFPYLQCMLYNAGVTYGDTSLRHLDCRQLAHQILSEPYRAFGVMCVGRRAECDCPDECDCEYDLMSDTERDPGASPVGQSGTERDPGASPVGQPSDTVRGSPGTLNDKQFKDSPVVQLRREALQCLVDAATNEENRYDSSQQALFTALYTWATEGDALPHSRKKGRFRPRKRFRAASYDGGGGGGADSIPSTPNAGAPGSPAEPSPEEMRWGAAVEMCEVLDLEEFDSWFLVEYVENSNLVREGRLVEAYRESMCAIDDNYELELAKRRDLEGKVQRRDRRIATLQNEIETLKRDARSKSGVRRTIRSSSQG